MCPRQGHKMLGRMRTLSRDRRLEDYLNVIAVFPVKQLPLPIQNKHEVGGEKGLKSLGLMGMGQGKRLR